MVYVENVRLHPNFAAKHSNLQGGLIAEVIVVSKSFDELNEIKNKIKGSYSGVELLAFEKPFVTEGDGFSFKLHYEADASTLHSYFEPHTREFFLKDKANNLTFEW